MKTEDKSSSKRVDHEMSWLMTPETSFSLTEENNTWFLEKNNKSVGGLRILYMHMIIQYICITVLLWLFIIVLIVVAYSLLCHRQTGTQRVLRMTRTHISPPRPCSSAPSRPLFGVWPPVAPWIHRSLGILVLCLSWNCGGCFCLVFSLNWRCFPKRSQAAAVKYVDCFCLLPA